MPWGLAGRTLILLTGEHAIHGSLRDKALQIREGGRTNLSRLHRNSPRVTTVKRPLGIFLPTALAAVRKMEQTALRTLQEKRLQQRADVHL